MKQHECHQSGNSKFQVYIFFFSSLVTRRAGADIDVAASKPSDMAHPISNGEKDVGLRFDLSPLLSWITLWARPENTGGSNNSPE